MEKRTIPINGSSKPRQQRKSCAIGTAARSTLVFIILALLTISCNAQVPVKLFATATTAPTFTPTITPTATPTPTLPPTPTPQPAARVETAEQALFNGSYDAARKEFENALRMSEDPELRAVAAVGIGQAYAMADNHIMVINTMEDLLAADPQNTLLANAYYFLGRSYSASQLYAQAADAYTKFVELRPGVLDAYMQNLRGDAYMAAGNPSAAVGAYQAAIEAPQEGTTIWTELKLARAFGDMGDHTNAVTKYLEIYEKSSSDYARAQANLLLGQLYLDMDMPEQAYARFLDSVYKFPTAFDSHTGLVILVNNQVEVNELDRGIVNYHAGQFGLSVEAINRYLQNNSERLATAYHYRALAHLAMNEPEQAAADWDYVIQNFPEDDLWSTAWEEKAYVLWAYLDQYQEAADTLLRFIEQAPTAAAAADFLFQAGRILERDDQLTAAAAVWERLIAEYPSAEMSQRALFLAGVSYYRVNDMDKALTTFQRAVVLATQPADQAAALLWIGKVRQKQGDQEAARTSWQQALQLDPTEYYSERAGELLNDISPFHMKQAVDMGYDLNAEHQQAQDWMRATFNLAADTDLNGLADIPNDPRFIRGKAYWELGLYEQGRNEFESLRKALATDPVRSFLLLKPMVQMGLYRSAVLTSRQVLDLANLDDVGTLTAPAYFNHIRFGIYYKDLVIQAGEKENFHPLFLLSVMRQESLFEGFAQSGAGARGLLQIMPATGVEIAASMGWPANYTTADLNRAEINIPMGARYLSRQFAYFQNDYYAALAAYNGGPGNTIQWTALAGGDPDLLLEVIRVAETRNYIMQIAEFFNLYRIIYQRSQ